MLKDLDMRLLSQNIDILFTDALKKYVLDQSFDEEFGARPVKRYIQKHIETCIASKILSSEIVPGISYVLDACNQEIRLLTK